MKHGLLLSVLALSVLASCSTDDTLGQEQAPPGNGLTAAIADGLHGNWSKGDRITLFHDAQTVSVVTLASGGTWGLSGSVEGTFTDGNAMYGVYPAESAVSSDRESITVSVPAAQTAGSDGYDTQAAVSVARTVSESLTFHAIGGDITGEYTPLQSAVIKWNEQGMPVVAETKNAASILVVNAVDDSGFTPGKDHYISTLPCDLYGGYRLSIYKDGLVAHYFGVHQTVERADYIPPTDLAESELEFDDPDAPLVESCGMVSGVTPT